MEINKLTSTNDRTSTLREADGKSNAKQLAEVGQGKSQSTGVDSADKLTAQTNVQLSSAAQILAEATDTLSKVADVDLERVQEIRTAIEKGTYHVDPQRLAANFVDLEQKLFG